MDGLGFSTNTWMFSQEIETLSLASSTTVLDFKPRFVDAVSSMLLEIPLSLEILESNVE